MTLHASEEDLKFLDAYRDFLPVLFIVSQAGLSTVATRLTQAQLRGVGATAASH